MSHIGIEYREICDNSIFKKFAWQIKNIILHYFIRLITMYTCIGRQDHISGFDCERSESIGILYKMMYFYF